MSALRSLLVVDDDRGIRESLADVLGDEGFTVHTSADGHEALRFLRTHPPPRLILLDWMMPGCNGAQFRSEQLADPQLAQIPVVLLTADARTEDKQRLLGGVDFVSKPVRLEQLLAVIERYFG